MQNDHDMDDSAGFADSLTDVGFFVGALAFFFAFCGLMFLLVPPMARYFAGYWS